MSKFVGKKLNIEVYGTSHGDKIGVKAYRLKPFRFDLKKLENFLNRRKPTYSPTFSGRNEPDQPIFLSGVERNADGKTAMLDGNAFQAEIYNKDVVKSDYADLYGKPRPSHADFAAYLKDGRLDFTGGGEFSGRMTAPLCVVGGILIQYLESLGIAIGAYISELGSVTGKSYKTDDITAVCYDESGFALSNGRKMYEKVLAAKMSSDSLGATAECIVFNLKGGVGGAMFDGLEGKISSLIYSVPGVKGVEFGSGFSFSDMCGSAANDPISVMDGKIVTLTNNSGGINGGISNGMPITMSVAMRPTPSIGTTQRTVDLTTGKPTTIKIRGRHDACFALRALPAIEAAVAIAIADELI